MATGEGKREAVMSKRPLMEASGEGGGYEAKGKTGLVEVAGRWQLAEAGDGGSEVAGKWRQVEVMCR